MNRTRAAALAAMTLAIALPAAACGGDDSDEFREDYNAAVENLSKVNDDIGQAAGDAGDSNAQIAKKFDEIADTAEQTRTDLAALEPPEDAKEEFDQLLAALKTGVADLRAVADAATSNDPAAATQAVSDLSESGAEITKAEAALKDAVDE
jgi:methyl-accepting chemotaxis protein